MPKPSILDHDYFDAHSGHVEKDTTVLAENIPFSVYFTRLDWLVACYEAHTGPCDEEQQPRIVKAVWTNLIDGGSASRIETGRF